MNLIFFIVQFVLIICFFLHWMVYIIALENKQYQNSEIKRVKWHWFEYLVCWTKRKEYGDSSNIISIKMKKAETKYQYQYVRQRNNMNIFKVHWPINF